jgi:hypothetical protein
MGIGEFTGNIHHRYHEEAEEAGIQQPKNAAVARLQYL